MIDSVKSVAPDVLLEPLVRAWIYHRSQWHPAMKSRIENCDLWNSAQEPFGQFHAFEFGTIMERSEIRNLRDFSTHFRSQRNGSFVFRAAMHHAVPDDVNFSKRRQRRPVAGR